MHYRDYTHLAARFEEYLLARQPFGMPDTLYEPVRYVNGLGGKRIRPLLLLMAYNLYHDDISPALPAALAVEYFHNFSLVHDDIMDEAPLRRGKKTVHQQYGRNAAILSGDAMLIRCFDLLLEAGNDTNTGAALCALMCKASLEICEGQQMDMDFERLVSPAEEEYLDMIRKKTACLLGVSLQLGALLAGADPHHAGVLYRFGEGIGMGFQVQDDYLDVFGDAGATGKVHGGDILRGKKNFLYVYAFNRLPPGDQKGFVEKYKSAALSGNIDEVIRLYNELDAGGQALRLQADLFTRGLEALDTLDFPDTISLKNFAQSMVARTY